MQRETIVQDEPGIDATVMNCSVTSDRRGKYYMRCPYCKSESVVRPSVAADQGSSSHLGVGIASGGLGIGLGASRTKEAKKARELDRKESDENFEADVTLSDKRGGLAFFLTTASLYYLEYWIIGTNWIEYFNILFLMIPISILYFFIPLVAGTFIGMHVKKSSRVRVADGLKLGREAYIGCVGAAVRVSKNKRGLLLPLSLCPVKLPRRQARYRLEGQNRK
jgi:hypothetical protein